MPVDLRDAWQSEASDFTPWLAQEENIALLSETIGIDLEVEAMEKSVGPFRADILCKDLDDQLVLIENQLEQTDHRHLGQLITYAAGLNTVTIVWISQKFREEHRAALDWLNSVTSEEVRFFGLQVELWRIGNSAIAPKFHVISSPNNWQKRAAGGAKGIEGGELTPAKDRRFRFWTKFLDYLQQRTCRFPVTHKPSTKTSLWFSLGRSGVRLVAIASLGLANNEDELRVEVSMGKETSQTFFDQFYAQREELETEMGEPLNWASDEEVKRKRIYLVKYVDLKDESQWSNYYQWLYQNLNALHQVFAPRVRQLIADVDEIAEDEQEENGDA
ncbi:DUF4268 domain-containing protein [Blastopirellula sp. J2-11]|uniref:DUF4268 domain-containing protein n=1 Tax=Blastopirellula sp. J2-11 TaxID=2943192 RepID=UPI0021C69C28|nr:DUF4268 domain-containing protein [Blastopirellula sp. J2-11]UUO09026.1 DUF4268 domain-containing protein [Blastopirellula sp. J2-11]